MISRRGLFGLGIGAALAALVGKGHVHSWRQAPAFLGYECECGELGPITSGYAQIGLTDATNYTFGSDSTITVIWPPLVIGSLSGGQNLTWTSG